MNVDLKKTMKPTLICAVVAATIALFIDYRISTSILIGSIVSIVHLLRLEKNIHRGLDEKRKLGGWIFMFVIDLAILAIPFALAIALPSLFDLFGAAIGLLINKAVLYTQNLKRKEE